MSKYVIFLMLLLSFSSCKKWLDITPKSQVAADVLFQTQEGFEEALNGVYTRCGQGDLYGDELTCGFLDVMAQDYTLSSVIDPLGYFQTAKFNFNDQNFINRKDNAWTGLYNAIVNVNLILANIDAKKALFSDEDYALIKGESLALRAYLHFDVFRMFGSGFNSTGLKIGIPYVTTYSNKVTPVSTPADVIKNVLADLNEAKALLKANDPIVSAGYIVDYPLLDTTKSTENTNPSLFLQNRRNRLNYYAVCGELARVYLYEGDKTNALANALEVINSKKFPWTNLAYFNNIDPTHHDLILYNELVFGWYIPQQAAALKTRFESSTAGLFIAKTDLQTIYETNGIGAEDLRFKQWFQIGIDGTTEGLEKYSRNPNAQLDDPTSDPYPLTAPAIRLSELYYIAAECSYDNNPTIAAGYVDTVLVHRGIGQLLTVTSKTAFIAALIKEERKEMFGEGQTFYMYKRLNMNIVGANGTLITASNNIFVLPLPNSEIEFGNR